MTSEPATAASEPRRLGRPADADAAATRERILGAARLAFAADGYDSTTNKRVALAAGVTPAALYHYFPSKGDLYRAVCESLYERLSQTMEPQRFAGGTLHSRLASIIDTIERASRNDPSLVAFLVGLNDEARRLPETQRLLEASHRSLREQMVRIVGDASDVEAVIGSDSVGDFADLFLASVGGAARLAVRRSDPSSMRGPLAMLLNLVRSRS